MERLEVELKSIAEVISPDKKVSMRLYTTEPGVQFYSGNHLSEPFQKHQGFCLETQHYPDTPNRPEFPSTVLDIGETYHSTTVYEFLTH